MIYVIALVPPMLLWLIFRIVMRLKVRRDAAVPKGLPLLTKLWGYPTLVIGYLLDLIVNVLHVSVLLLELPEELTVSARVSRHTHDETVPKWYMWPLVMYRRMVARLIRDRLLKPYDPSGGHD